MSDGEGPGRHVDAIDLDLVSRKQQQSTLGHGVCFCKAHFLLSKVRLERNVLGDFNEGTELKDPVPCLKYRTCVFSKCFFFSLLDFKLLICSMKTMTLESNCWLIHEVPSSLEIYYNMLSFFSKTYFFKI